MEEDLVRCVFSIGCCRVWDGGRDGGRDGNQCGM